MEGLNVLILDSAAAAASNPMAGVSKDATSGIYVPASWAQWQTTLTASSLTSVNAPYALYQCQESNGNLADSIGGGGTATSFGGPNYGVTIPGWSRVGVGFPGVGGVPEFLANAPNLATTSFLAISYNSISSAPLPGAFGVNLRGNATVATSACVQASAGSSVILNDDGASATGSSNLGTTHHPVVLKYDHTNSVATVYTDQEHVSTPTFVQLAGSSMTIGAAVSVFSSTQSTSSYAVMFQGPAAELSDAQVKKLLQQLGWTTAW